MIVNLLLISPTHLEVLDELLYLPVLGRQVSVRLAAPLNRLLLLLALGRALAETVLSVVGRLGAHARWHLLLLGHLLVIFLFSVFQHNYTDVYLLYVYLF